MRTPMSILCFSLILFFPGIPEATPFSIEQNVNRSGGDFLRYQQIGHHERCRQLCDGDARCVSFTWVRPGRQGPTGNCWLKNSIPRPNRDNCCISGVKRIAKRDFCKWRQYANTYECKCQNSRTKAWYLANPSSCTQPKPTPKYINPDQGPGGSCLFGQC